MSLDGWSHSLVGLPYSSAAAVLARRGEQHQVRLTGPPGTDASGVGEPRVIQERRLAGDRLLILAYRDGVGA